MPRAANGSETEFRFLEATTPIHSVKHGSTALPHHRRVGKASSREESGKEICMSGRLFKRSMHERQLPGV